MTALRTWESRPLSWRFAFWRRPGFPFFATFCHHLTFRVFQVRSLRSHSSVSSRPKAHRDRPRPVQYSDSLFAVLDFQPTAQSDAHSRSDFLQLSHLTGPPSRVHSARHHSSFFARQEATASSTSVPGTRVRKSGRPLQPDGLEDALSLSRELNFRDHTASR
eukprot:m.541820 g.541820  ORF g.541820 m.541820 type:complete len:162 (+) comp57653_c0_seq3:1398-1883(+)